MFKYEPLAKTLKERGMTLSQLAEEAGIRGSYLVSRMNGGEYVPSEYLDKICNVLNVSLDKVVVWKKGEQSSSERVSPDWDKITALLGESDISLNKLSEKCRLSKCALSIARKRGGSLKKTVVNDIARNLGCKIEDLI